MPPAHWLSIGDIGPATAAAVLDRASDLAKQTRFEPLGVGKVVGLFFFQPSTRTRIGFQVAAARLGAGSVLLEQTKYQPGMDGPESIPDTVRVGAGYCDVLVVRHGDFAELADAAGRAKVPVINGGGGQRHHPTQALIDLFAIRARLGRLDALRVGVAGDLATSRSAHSFLQALAWYAPSEVRLMGPQGREIAGSVVEALGPSCVTLRADFSAEDLDVLYMAGMPPGIGEKALDDGLRDRFRLTRRRMADLPQRGIALCALPRTGDIDPDVDDDPRSAYFQQSDWGLFVRMAILEQFMGA
jgi:aspartate carbamoyltransferase catalytic subunit